MRLGGKDGARKLDIPTEIDMQYILTGNKSHLSIHHGLINANV